MTTLQFAYLSRRAARAECAKQTAAIGVAMARMSGKASSDARPVEHSEIDGLPYYRWRGVPAIGAIPSLANKARSFSAAGLPVVSNFSP